jgi:MFS family permease
MKKAIQSESKKQPVIIVALVTAICLMGDSMLYIALPIYWKEVGLLSLWEVGLLLSINRFVRLPLNPLIGWLYKKISLRTGLLIAVALATLTTVGYGLASGLVMWLILRCIWGVAWSLLRLGGFFTVIRCSEDYNRGQFMGTYNGLYRLGSLFGMLVGGFLASIIGLQAVALLFGVLSLLGIPLILGYVKASQGATGDIESTNTISSHEKKPVKVELSTMRFKDWLSKPLLKVILSGLLLTLLFEGVLTSTLSYVIAYHYEQGIYIFGMVLGATTIAGTIQAVRWAWGPVVSTRIGRWSDGVKGRIPLFITALLTSAFGFLLIPFTLPFYLWMVIILLVLLSSTAITTLMDSLASDVAKKKSVITVMTVYSVALDLGAALGPFISYLVIRMEYGLFYIYIGGACILVTLATIWFFSSLSINKQSRQEVTISE